MCFGGSPSAPPAPAPAPQANDPSVTIARDAERRRQRAAGSQTILTGPQGTAAPPTTAGKSLLGM